MSINIIIRIIQITMIMIRVINNNDDDEYDHN